MHNCLFYPLFGQCMHPRTLKLHFFFSTLHAFVVMYVKPIKMLLFSVVSVHLDLLTYFLLIFNLGLPSEITFCQGIWGNSFSISSSAHLLVMNYLIFAWKNVFLPSYSKYIFSGCNILSCFLAVLSSHRSRSHHFCWEVSSQVLLLLSWKVTISLLH